MKLRCGLLGTGHWAARTHAVALHGHPDADLVGVWGRAPEKAAQLARQFDAEAFDDLDALFEAVDAVAIALPPAVQGELALRAARAGKHLLLDKPVALDPAVATELAEVVTRAGLASLVFTTNRFRPNIEAFLAAAVATGGWAGAELSSLNSIDGPGNPYGASAWRRDKGGLWDVGPHALSVLVPVLGPVIEVTAVPGRYDIVQLALRHQGGALSTAALGVYVPESMTAHSTVFYGPAGRRAVPDGDTDSVTACRLAIARLAGNVAAGRVADPLDVRAGRDAVAVLSAAETSIAERRTITI